MILGHQCFAPYHVGNHWNQKSLQICTIMCPMMASFPNLYFIVKNRYCKCIKQPWLFMVLAVIYVHIKGWYPRENQAHEVSHRENPKLWILFLYMYTITFEWYVIPRYAPITYVWVVLNTIILVLSRFTTKSLLIQNEFKAFWCLCTPESKINTMSSGYSNISMAYSMSSTSQSFYVIRNLIYKKNEKLWW